MKVLSLFDGMSCGMIAFRQLGIPVDEYHAYEIDKYAVKVSYHNFPEIIHHGDVFQGDFTAYKGYDWLIGGSPCTYWSIAQNPENRETTASGVGWELFQQYVRALHKAEPEYFLYENNYSMSEAIKNSISEAFGFEPIMINSSLVSAQSRKRLYWVGRNNGDGTYSKCMINQPEDRGLIVRDIIDNAEPLNTTEGGKSNTIKAQYSKNGVPNFVKYDSTYGATGVALPIQVGAMARPNGEQSHSQGFRIYSIDGKTVTLKGNAGGAGGKTGLYAIKSNGKEIPLYEVKNGKIRYKSGEYPIKLPDGLYVIRKLTVSECMRLQTVPDWYDFAVISNTQAYKCLGNGWTVEVIMHLIQSAMQGKTEPCYRQLGFF
ncbi:MAG: DNA (cytosine-5-)-methyltransferase [Oscillospiraceae bacterium]|nr:DNA (cytosine-5-)-methyltransferase [Oscillospiraceae bacterium]